MGSSCMDCGGEEKKGEPIISGSVRKITEEELIARIQETKTMKIYVATQMLVTGDLLIIE